MIKTYVSVKLGDKSFTFQDVRPDLGTEEHADIHAAVALLRETADKLCEAVGTPTEFPVLRDCGSGQHGKCYNPDVCGCECHRTRWEYVHRMDENGNRQCYLCGFYHDEPGSCANGTPTNITPGPDDEPEYDGPTDDGYHGPEEGDYRESTFPTLDEILETGRPYCDDECAAVNGPYADRVAAAVVEASKRDEDSNASS